MTEGDLPLQPPLTVSERRKMDEDVRKTSLASQREVERRRAVASLTEEHVRFTARYDALYLATLYKELNEAKLPEGVIRSIIGAADVTLSTRTPPGAHAIMSPVMATRRGSTSPRMGLPLDTGSCH